MPTLSGVVDNTGTIFVNPGDGVGVGDSNNPGGATLEGGGAIDLQGGSGIGANVGGAVLTNVDNTIEATGGDTNGYNQNGLSIDVINEASGVIEAAGANNGQGVLVIHNDITNDGKLAATGAGAMYIDTLTIDNSGGGVIDANGGGSQISLDGTTVEGGTLQTESGGEIYVSTGTLDGSSSTVTNTGNLVGGSVTLVGAIDNQGSITIQDSNGGIGIGDTSYANATLSGGGQIILQGGVGIGGGGLLTNVDNTIDGAGGDSNGFDQNSLSVDVLNEQNGVIEAAGDNAGHGILVVHNNITNDGILSASGGGVLRLTAVTIDNTDGGVMSATGANAQITLDGTTIEGGTLETANGGTFVLSNSDASVLDGSASTVTNNAAIIGGEVILAGAIDNQGSITIQDADGYVAIGTASDASATLSGNGQIILQGGDDLGAAVSGALLINAGNTIAATGGDTNGYDQNGLTINVLNEQGGTIEAAGANNGQGILIDHNAITNDGTLASTGGGNLVLEGNVLNDGIVLGNGGTVNVNALLIGSGEVEVEGGGRVNLVNGTSENATFAGSGGVLALANAYSFSGTISGLSGTLDLENIPFPPPTPPGPGPIEEYPLSSYWTGFGDQYYTLTYVQNGLGTGGTLELNEFAQYTVISADEDNNVVGTGWDEFQDIWSVQLVGSGYSSFSLNGDGNGGTDIAISTFGASNTAHWSGGSGTWQKAGNWEPASIPTLDNNVVISAAGTYTITDAQSTTIDALDLAASGATLAISGGDFTINDGTGSGDLAGTIRVAAGATLTLSGVVEATATGKITTVASTIVTTIAVGPSPGATVDLISAYLDGGSVVIANGALVAATQESSTLAGVTVTDRGTLAAAAGGTLALVNTTVNGGNGGVIQADDGSHALVLLDGATINGATFVSDASDTIEVIGSTATALTHVTIEAGTIALLDGSAATLSGLISDYGTLALDASGDTTKLVLAGTVTLQGSGMLTMSDSANNAIYSNGASAHLINDITIQGSGTIGDGATVLTNGGTIDATGTVNALVLNYAGAFQNQGAAEATGNAGLTINGNVANSGTLAADGGNLSVAGAVTGTGNATIADGSTLSLAKTVAATQNVTFEDATGTLALGVAQNFAGTVSGLVAGDAIDLENFVYGPKRVSISGVTQSGNDTLVTVKDGALTTTIALVNQSAGEYSSNAGAYSLTSDQRGSTPGTLLELVAAPVA